MKYNIFSILLVGVLFSGCGDEEYIKGNIAYKSKALYDSITINIDENSFQQIKKHICESKHNIIPLSKSQLRQINLLTTEMHIKIHQADPNFESPYLGSQYYEKADEHLVTGLMAGTGVKSSSFIALGLMAMDEYQYRRILNDPEIKKIMLPYEKQIDESIEYYKKANIGKCDLKINKFKLGNWYTQSSFTRNLPLVGKKYDGQMRDLELYLSINNVYSLEVDYTEYDNKTYTFDVKVIDQKEQ